MNYYKDVKLYDGVKEVIDLGEYGKYSEMTDFEKSFLLGLVKEKKPSKILEIGVAAGATTAIISSFIEKEKESTEIYSVDLNYKMWNDPSLNTGFVLEKCVKNFKYVKNNLLTGYVAAHWLEKIGGNIDFLILDTTHTLPGEVLDFLACYPFLSKDAVVVLHDVALNHTGVSHPESLYEMKYFSSAFATKVLLMSVYAEKYYMADSINPYQISNISAFKLTEETGKYLENVISSLTLTWDYIPDMLQWLDYRGIFSKYYENGLARKLENIYCLQKRADSYRYISSHYKGEIRTFYERWKKSKDIYIYGCGFLGEKYYFFSKENNLPLKGMIVSDGVDIKNEWKKKYDCPIYHLSEVAKISNDAYILIASYGKNYEECLGECIKNNMTNIF